MDEEGHVLAEKTDAMTDKKTETNANAKDVIATIAKAAKIAAKSH